MWPFRGSRKVRLSRPVALGVRSARRRLVEGRHDAAQTTAENVRHWAMADSLSAGGPVGLPEGNSLTPALPPWQWADAEASARSTFSPRHR